jgi:ABC-type branched-subunit amino acid transport system substrate-binding protein
MSLARSPGAATLRALALCATASRAFAACGRDGGEPDSQVALAYDAARPMARALAGGRQTPEAIRGYLEHVGQDDGPPAFEGVAGRVAFDSNGDPVNKQFTLGVIQGGRIVLPRGAR